MSWLFMKHDFSKQEVQNIFESFAKWNETWNKQGKVLQLCIHHLHEATIEFTHMYFGEYFNDAYIIFVEKTGYVVSVKLAKIFSTYDTYRLSILYWASSVFFTLIRLRTFFGHDMRKLTWKLSQWTFPTCNQQK